MQSLLRVIQQRRIDRVAAAYAVAAWILVQAASIAFPTFGAPPWVLKVLIVAAIAGFPLALWIAWHVSAPAPAAPAARPFSGPADIALLSVLTLVIVLVGTQFAFEMGLWPAHTRAAKPPADRTSVAIAGNPRRAGSAPVSATAQAPPASIAVLPFLNLSGNPAKEFFSDGVSEEILNDLGNARELRVAARTSSFAFKGKSEDIRKIARALDVRTIVEGSVREDGQRIRIVAQLIDGSNGYQIWSKAYDRDLNDILQVQDEIAQSITVALTHTLAPNRPTRVAARTPIDPEAYRDYLKGRSLAALKTDDGDAQAVELLRQVTERAPDFAPAFAALGRTYVHMAQTNSQRREWVRDASAALNKALALDSGNLEALSSDLYLALMNWDWATASRDAGWLQSLNPHSVFTLRGLNAYYASFGFAGRQAAALREVTRLDPLSFVDLNNLATAYNNRGDYAEAASAALDALALKPDRPLALYSLCAAYAGMKRVDKARAISAKLSFLHEADAADGCTLRVALASGDLSKARKLAGAIAKRFPAFVFDETDIASFYAETGGLSTALAWLRRGYDARNPGLFSLAYSPSAPPGLVEASGWKELMARPEARAWQAARGKLTNDLRDK